MESTVDDEAACAALKQLLDVMRRLRDPDSGCPWDIKQTFASIAPYTIEEAYEVADAIEREDLPALQDELGDLLLQVVYHAQMASEVSQFSFVDVAQSIVDKMIRRHPHVFSDRHFATEAELKQSWETIKAGERQAKENRKANNGSDMETASALDGIAKSLPALKKADKIQTRAARAGFDWPDVAPVWLKLNEEINEVKDALATSDRRAVQNELGDLLFTVVNLARHCGVDSEQALNSAMAKFERRFRSMENAASQGAVQISAQPLDVLDRLWEQAKIAERDVNDEQ